MKEDHLNIKIVAVPSTFNMLVYKLTKLNVCINK